MTWSHQILCDDDIDRDGPSIGTSSTNDDVVDIGLKRALASNSKINERQTISKDLPHAYTKHGWLAGWLAAWVAGRSVVATRRQQCVQQPVTEYSAELLLRSAQRRNVMIQRQNRL